MRAYMYAYRYKHARLAKETILPYNLPENPCAECSVCTVSCPLGYEVGASVAAVTPVVRVPDEFLS